MGILGYIISFITKIGTFLVNTGTKLNKKENKFITKLLNWTSRLLFLVSTVWILVIAFPLLIKIALICIIILIAIAVVLIIMATVTGGLLDGSGDYASNYNGNGASVSVEGFLAFTQEELDMYGGTLTEYEKNIYRLGILSKDAMNGYGDTKYFTDYDVNTNIVFLLGISSTETSMRFYTSATNTSNILTTPSDIPINGSGFGVMGLCGRTGGCYAKDGKLQSIQYHLGALSDDARASIVSKYPLAQEPSPTVNFYPYSVFYATRHLAQKETVASKYVGRAMAVFDDWGLKSNRAEVETTVLHFMIQAAFHGVDLKAETEHYANFWAAMLHASSEIDEERSFSRWTIPHDSEAGYDESGVRKSFNGTTGCDNYPPNGDPSTWSGVGTPIHVNGVKLDVPVWTYLHSKYKGNAGWEGAVKQTWEWAKHCRGSGANARTLNFHYGVNSFLQGNRIITMLREKMPIPKNSSQAENLNPQGYVKIGNKLRANPVKSSQVGVAQGQITINGKTEPTSKYLANFYSKSYTSYYNSLIKHAGEAGYYTNTNHYGKEFNGDYENFNFFGVPFYSQSTNIAKSETYNNKGYGAKTNDSFGVYGCMVFSSSYVASAFTGLLINPAEMALILTARGGLSDFTAWSADQNHGKVISELTGGNAKYKFYPEGQTHSALMLAVTNELNKGNAMAIVRLGKPYAYTTNHYVVLTGAVMLDNGEIGYTMYSSSNMEHTTLVHSLQDLSRKGGNRYQATVFYYN